jgi:branched-chain amino acid transport system permease protein
MTTATIAGLSTGAVYALIAIGYNITLTSAGILNFSFANVLVLGGFIAIGTTSLGLPLVATVVVCALACAVVSVTVERAAIRFMPGGSHAELVTTLGAATVITAVTALVWGSEPRRLALFHQSPFDLLGGHALPIDLVLVALPLLFGIGMHQLLTRTRFGLTSRAQAFDREATMLRGVDVRRLSIGAFALSGTVAGIAGPFVLMATSASPYVALGLALKGFVALALGGLGSQLGAVLAGFVIGLVEAYAALRIGSFYGDYAVFAVFVLVLLFRSHGIFGKPHVRLV